MVCILEQGVYQLVFKSTKPEARRFQRWLIQDVLPSINQTGNYISNINNNLDPNIAALVVSSQNTLASINSLGFRS